MKNSSILLLLSITLVLSSCNNNKKKEIEQIKNSWKVKTYQQQTENNKEPKSDHSEKLVKVITDQNFDKLIAEGVSMVDFWATWCRPCLMQAPIVEQIAEEVEGKARVYKMDVDQNPFVPQRFGIQNIPTLMIFKDGKMVERFVGLQDKKTLKAALLKHIQEEGKIETH